MGQMVADDPVLSMALAATTLAGSGLLPSFGGPRTLVGQGKPLVLKSDHAFKIVPLNLAPFKRDTSREVD